MRILLLACAVLAYDVRIEYSGELSSGADSQHAILLPNQNASFKCIVPRSTVAVKWFLDARLLGTSLVNDRRPDKSSWENSFPEDELDFVLEPLDTKALNPREQFKALKAHSQLTRAGGNRSRRSSRRVMEDHPWMIRKGNIMMITDVNEKIEGSFSCVAKLKKTAIASEPIKLTIAKLGKFWNLGNLGPVRSEVNQPVMLDCPDIDSTPEARFNWFKVAQDGERQLLRDNDPRYDFHRNGKKLFIKSVQPGDEGSYTCEAVNDFLGRSQKLWAFSNPKEVKIVANGISNQYRRIPLNSVLGQDLVLEPASNSARWYFNNEKLTPGRGGFDSLSLENGILMVRGLSMRNEGQYTSIDESRNVTFQYDVRLSYPPRFTDSLPDTVTVDECRRGSRCPMVECPNFIAYPEGKVKWKVNGRELSESERTIPVRTNEYYSNDEKSIYQCFVSNELGDISFTQTVHIRSKSAPKFKEEKFPVKLKDVMCHQAGDAYNITVEWKSSLISPGTLCFSVYKEDNEENFNLYQLSYEKDKQKKCINSDELEIQIPVDSSGEYLVELNAGKTRRKEPTRRVTCPIRRPRLCPRREKLPRSIPSVMEVNAQTAHLDTGVDAVTVDWQVDRFIKTTGSVWDRFEIQCKVNGKWKSDLERHINVSLAEVPSATELPHFAFPYQLTEFDTSQRVQFRVRRIWSRTCISDKSEWAKSNEIFIQKPQVTSTLQLQNPPSSISVTITHDGRSAFWIHLMSSRVSQNVGAVKICWAEATPYAAIKRKAVCHQTGDFNTREVDIELADIPETSASWTISVFSQDYQIYQKTIELQRLRSEVSYSNSAPYRISAAATPEITKGGWNPLNCFDANTTIQGVIVGILAIFLVFCIASVVYILKFKRLPQHNGQITSKKEIDQRRTRRGDFGLEKETPPPEYPADEIRDTSTLLRQQPKRVALPPLSTFGNSMILENPKVQSTTTTPTPLMRDYNSQSTIPYSGTLSIRNQNNDCS
ncbi:Oidioi.mRNA.OKI2018_I69.PAR.g11463.t1.cds [Oikopleura dioica]|uniref:Oidioi.mRNA.OKI2018_I69.PAR.g11463.t1.cds n=1 Tax=Oikopleura dioica TaxID=34765 RepID=A0ABN7RVR0_OIKDI|nr:Oidioi.mRNA.OKI2018_I69.PAR.g11463.t1.cds [Oikopleura dioica]